MSDQAPKQDTNQAPQQPPQEDKPTTDYSLGRRFVGNSADKARKKDTPR